MRTDGSYNRENSLEEDPSRVIHGCSQKALEPDKRISKHHSDL